MHESPMTEKLALRWVGVTDERGRALLEMRWSAPATLAAAPPVPAASPVPAAQDIPAVTHAA